MKFKSNFKVTAPATLSSFCGSTHAFGLALAGLQDEIIVRSSEKAGIHIDSIQKNKTNISLEIKENAAGISAAAVLQHLQEEHDLDPTLGLSLQLNKKVPSAYGLGSSAASATAAALAVNEAFGRPLEKKELLPFVLEGEQFAEGQFRVNGAAASLFGGCMLVSDEQNLAYHRLPLIRGLHLVVMHASYPRRNRAQMIKENLPTAIDLTDISTMQSKGAALVQAFYTSNLDLLASALRDNFLDPHLSALIPFYQELKEAALEEQALALGPTGSGTACYALCKNSLDAQHVLDRVKKIYEGNKQRHTAFISTIDHEGAIIA